MKIAFIWPHANTVYQTLPLSFGLLYRAIADQGHDVRMFNLPLEGWTADSPEFRRALASFAPDLVCASAWAVSFQSVVAAMQVAREVAPRAVRLLGGNYPTLNPKQAWAPGCFDYLLLGEAERSFAAFTLALAQGDHARLAEIPGIYLEKPDGAVIRARTEPFVDDLDTVGFPDWSFVQLDRAIARGYMSTILGPRRKVAILVSRGCEYACNFCAAPLMNGQALRHYSVPAIAREARLLYEKHGIRMLYLMDDNATQDQAFFKDMCRGIAALGLRDLQLELYRGIRLENLDEEMLELMKRAGFYQATIAPESGSARVRDLMRKDMTDEAIRTAAARIRRAGLSLQAYFIVGFPGETADERRATYRMIDDLDVDVFSLHKYQAIPGTATFRKLVKLGKIGREHTDSGHLIGEGLPNYNGDLPADIDREILGVYASFYARKPWKVPHLLKMASAGGLKRSFLGTAKAGLKAAVGLGRADSHLPSVREPM